MKTTPSALSFAFAVAMALGLAAAAPTAIDTDIAEAVFSYQFAHNESMQQSTVDVYCVGYKLENDNWSDPPGEVLARFAGLNPRVVPSSQCPCNQSDSKQHSWVMFRINAVKCVNNASCEVEGGYYENPESASGNTYYLEKQSGKWFVTRDVMHWIS